jgi:hypothetical protein
VPWFLAAPAALAADDALAQARFAIKKRYWADARDLLAAHVASPEGRIDPEAWYLLAQVRFELLDLPGAAEAAERAHSYSRNDAELEQASNYATFLRDNFGTVALSATHDGLSGSVVVEIAVPLLDPTVEAWFSRQKKQLGARQVLPLRFGLPAGAYTINGKPVTVNPGTITEVTLADSDIAGRQAMFQLSRVELGVSLGNWFGPDVATLLPSPRGHLSVLQPIGPVVIGATVTGGARWYTDIDGEMRTAFNEVSGGVSVGLEAHGPRFLLRPAVGYRYGTLPGIELRCARDGESYACGSDGDAELMVYGVARVHIPYVEASLDWVDVRDRRIIGFGAQIAAEQAIGALPERGTALDPAGSATPYHVLSNARGVVATGGRIGLHLTLAF